MISKYHFIFSHNVLIIVDRFLIVGNYFLKKLLLFYLDTEVIHLLFSFYFLLSLKNVNVMDKNR